MLTVRGGSDRVSCTQGIASGAGHPERFYHLQFSRHDLELHCWQVSAAGDHN